MSIQTGYPRGYGAPTVDAYGAYGGAGTKADAFVAAEDSPGQQNAKVQNQRVTGVTIRP